MSDAYKSTFADADYEIRGIRDRLSMRETIYVARPAGIEAALALRAAGEVLCQWGEDKDRGILLVRKAPGRNLRPGALRGDMIA